LPRKIFSRKIIYDEQEGSMPDNADDEKYKPNKIYTFLLMEVIKEEFKINCYRTQ
jgi:hypothetical protein